MLRNISETSWLKIFDKHVIKETCNTPASILQKSLSQKVENAIS